MKIYMTIREASEHTGLSQFFIRSGCRTGEIPHIMSGAKYLVDLPAFLSLLREMEHSTEGGINNGNVASGKTD